MLKRAFLTLSLILLAPVVACAQDGGSYEEGKHYDAISPAVRTASPGKIEVAEFFWYGCSHCYTFEPLIGQWKKTLAEDVTFRGIPAMWGGAMELHARAFYTAQALGVLDKIGRTPSPTDKRTRSPNCSWSTAYPRKTSGKRSARSAWRARCARPMPLRAVPALPAHPRSW